MLSGNPPQILRSTRVTFYGVIAHGMKLPHEPKPTIGEHAHGTKRDGEEADASALKLPIAFPQVFARTVVDRAPSLWQTQRSIDWDQCGASVVHEVDNLLVAECHVRFSGQIS